MDIRKFKSLFAFLFFVSYCALGQTDTASNAAQEAIKMRNNLDQYLLQNIGDKPNTLKEKFLSAKIDSLLKVTELQQNQLSKKLRSEPSEAAKKGIELELFFESNSFELSNLEEQKISEFIKNNSGTSIQIIASSDAYGEEAYNLSLAIKRGNKVKNILLSNQFNGQVDIMATAIDPNALGSLAKANRKAKIILQ
ncbi:MAG: OmpA family protein [Bacteroidia bacterium]|nr:OmpA family protein [Bacteroidia bacterium]MCF8428203.1 OmpA family protein [Bacteroidia bacterium]